MAVRIEKTFHAAAPVEKVWGLLRDPSNVATCIPGARITAKVDDRTFQGAISVKVGPAVTDYKGEVRIDRLDDEAHEIEMTGKGIDVRGKGSASMKMTGRVTALPDGGSEVVTVSEVNVVGILAQFGGRMIQEVSDLMFRDFSKRFQQKLERGEQPTEESPAAAEPVNAVKLGAAAIGGTVRKLFGGSPENK